VALLTKEVLIIVANEEFWSAYEIVPLIVLATTIFSFHYHLDVGIVMSKNTKYLAYVNLSNAAFVIILNFILIPPYGVFGAAWATLFAFIYKGLLTYHFSSRYFKVHFEKARLIKLTMTIALIYIVVNMIEVESVYLSLALRGLCITLSYPAILYMLRFFSDTEKATIMEVIRTKNISRIWQDR
jgi:O-antigen/teichoic acid export membrane protein